MIRKRVIDLLGSGLGLLALSPLLVLISTAVLLADGWPVLFRQTRVGRSGRPFKIMKFRTMSPRRDGSGPRVTASGDQRITALGRLLRNAKLDELPQLVNVLKGDMSLVGPRPEVPEYVALYPVAARARILSVRPGMTDPVSSAFFQEEDLLAGAADPGRYYVERILPVKIRGYLQYVEQQSLAGDLAIVLKTVGQVLRLAPRATKTNTVG